MLHDQARLIPGWVGSVKGSKVLSKWRQKHYENAHLRSATMYQPATIKEKILCLIPSYALAVQENYDMKKRLSMLEHLIAEKRSKLADSDAQVAELSKARDGLYRLAKERGKKLEAAGLEK